MPSGIELQTISGDYIVWDVAEDIHSYITTSQIYMYQISTGQTTQLTDDEYRNASPSTDGEKIVWTKDTIFPYPSGHPVSDIMLYDIATTHVTNLTTSLSQQFPDSQSENLNPSIDGDVVAWMNGISIDQYEIYTTGIATGIVTRLTNNSAPDNLPKVSNGRVVWLGSYVEPDGRGEITINLYDGNQTKRINPVGTTVVDGIDVAQDTIAWSSTAADGGYSSVKVYNAVTSDLRTIEPSEEPYNFQSSTSLSANGQNLGWYQSKQLNGDTLGLQIWTVDLSSTDPPSKVTEASRQTATPLALGNGFIAWPTTDRDGYNYFIDIATPAPPAPAFPTNLAASTPTNQSATLRWDAAAGADHYDVYRDGVKVGTSFSTVYADNALEGTRTYYVKAVSLSGGTSAASNMVTVVVDKTPPTVSNLTMTGLVKIPLLGYTITGNKSTVKASVSDLLSGVARTEYYFDVDPGQGNGTPMTLNNGQVTANASLVGLGITRPHTLNVRSQDAAGNWSIVSAITFRRL